MAATASPVSGAADVAAHHLPRHRRGGDQPLDAVVARGGQDRRAQHASRLGGPDHARAAARAGRLRGGTTSPAGAGSPLRAAPTGTAPVLDAERVHRRAGHDRPRQGLVGAGRRSPRPARPGRRRPSAAMKAVIWASPLRLSSAPRPRTGRARRGAGEPGQGAEGLAGGDDPVGAARSPAASRRARTAGRSTKSRSAATSSRPGGSPVKWSRVSRAAPSGSDSATSGSSSRAGGELERPAADVEADQVARAPTQPAAHREEGQPGLVLAGEHLQVHPGLLGGAAQHLRRCCSRRGPPRWRTRAARRT